MRPPPPAAQDHLHQLQLALCLATKRWPIPQLAKEMGVSYHTVRYALRGVHIGYGVGKVLETWLQDHGLWDMAPIVQAYKQRGSVAAVEQLGYSRSAIEAALQEAL